MEFEKSKLLELKEKFDYIINTEEKDNIEFWYARDLQIQLGYKRWENFIETIKKAMQSCENAGIPVENHFREVTKMINLARGVDDLGFARIRSKGDSALFGGLACG